MKSIQGKVIDSYGVAFDTFKAVNHGCNNGEAIELLLDFYMSHNAEFESFVISRCSNLAKGEAKPPLNEAQALSNVRVS